MADPVFVKAAEITFMGRSIADMTREELLAVVEQLNFRIAQLVEQIRALQ
jgi:hypothetical protein